MEHASVLALGEKYMVPLASDMGTAALGEKYMLWENKMIFNSIVKHR
jgi:hypothetical protein